MAERKINFRALPALCLGLILICILIAFAMRNLTAPSRISDTEHPLPVSAPPLRQAAPLAGAEIIKPKAPVQAVTTRPENSGPTVASMAGTRRAEELMNQLLLLAPEATTKPENASQIASAISQLKGEGAAALPGIREYLNHFEDISFRDVKGLAGYSSLRTALFNTLSEIGGPEASEILLQTLRNTGDPREIGLLANYLDKAAPSAHREEIVNAARDALPELLKPGAASDDAAPIFETLRKFGDASLISDLAGALPQWSHYASIALAGLPEGQGLPAILEAAQSTETRKPVHYLLSFQLLAQAAGQQPLAASGLVDLAQQNRIPAAAWTQIAQGLTSAPDYALGKPDLARSEAPKPQSPVAGWKTFKVGNQQHFYSRPLDSQADATIVEGRLQFVNELLAATSSSEGREALQKAQEQLQRGKL